MWGRAKPRVRGSSLMVNGQGFVTRFDSHQSPNSEGRWGRGRGHRPEPFQAREKREKTRWVVGVANLQERSRQQEARDKDGQSEGVLTSQYRGVLFRRGK